MGNVNPWLFWAVTGIIGGLVLLSIAMLKWWMNKQQKLADSLTEKGGVVSRDAFFEWCEKFRTECPIKKVIDWGKGGPLMIKDHEAICTRVTDKIDKRIDDCFETQTKLFETKFNLIQTTLEKTVLEEIRDLKKEIQNGR